MRPKVVASVVVLGIAALPACSDASMAGPTSSGSTSPQTSSTQSTASPVPPGGTTSSKSARIRVNPTAGHRRTHFAVAFTAPQKTGAIASSIRRYQVSASTTQKQGCVASSFKAVGASRAGARVSTTLTPVGGSWCTGSYLGRIIETVMARCQPARLCPAFVGVVRVVGTFKFRVS